MPVNFYRVRVDANTSFTNARYVGGYYDERAVDLFFNELKPTPQPTPFGSDLKNPGTDDRIVPLDPDAEHGAFVMILSTNADSIADTLGALTENEAAIQALNNLLNKGQLEAMEKGDAAVPGDKLAAQATKAQVQALAGVLAPGDDAVSAQGKALRIINALAMAAGSPSPFQTIDAAKAWLERQGGGP
jgi:hypothetical protein